jgi:tetratricopeptide (TPR) repeat protein
MLAGSRYLIAAAVAFTMLGAGSASAKSASEMCFATMLDVAVAACTKAIKQNPKDPNLYFWRAPWEDDDKAISDLGEVIRLAPRNVAAYYLRGYRWQNKQEYDLAIADFSEAIRLNPKYAEAYTDRGVSWNHKHDYDKAITDLNEAIRLDPKWLPAYVGRGRTWSNKHDDEKAIADYSEAIRQNPQLAVPYFERGLSWEKKGNFEQSLSDMKEFAKLAPENTDGPKQVARLEAKIASQTTQNPPQIVQQLAPQPQQQAAVQPTQPPAAVQAGRRVALVIGNTKYQYAPALQNPTNDAQLLASTLQNIGFQSVTLKTDLTRDQMIQALRDFGTVADSADWAVVYFSGHGIEFGGVNYMIPVDAQLKVDRDIDLEGIDLGKVLGSIDGANRLRLVILDACRDNPFASQMRRSMATRSVGKGLARIEPDAGTLVVYAAKNGETAFDGNGKNSPFVEALVRRIQERPSRDVRRLFDTVRDDVLASTHRKQQPYSYGSLPGDEDFYFVR